MNLQKIENIKYLTMHVCAQKIIQENTELTNDIYYIKAGIHPFKLHWDYNWKIKIMINDIFNNNNIYVPKMMKFRGDDRKLFDKYIKKGKKYSEKSLYSRYIKNL